MFRDAVALPAKCFEQGDTRTSEGRYSIRHTRKMAPNSPNSGFQGLRFSHLSLRSAVNDRSLEQGRGKVLLVFERQNTSRNPVL